MMYNRSHLSSPKTTQHSVPVGSQNEPYFQGIEGKGWFMAARLTITSANMNDIGQLRFALKIDNNLVYYGMLAWYLGSMGKFNPFGVVVTVDEDFSSDTGAKLVSIVMGLPYPLQYYRSIKASVSSPLGNGHPETAAMLQITATQEYQMNCIQHEEHTFLPRQQMAHRN